MAETQQARGYRIKVDGERMKIDENYAPDGENAAAGVIVGDLWGYIDDVNQDIVKMFGAENKGEFIGKHLLEFVAKNEKTRAMNNSLNSIATGLPTTATYHARLKNGGEVALEVETDFIKNEKGETLGFIDIVRKKP